MARAVKGKTLSRNAKSMPMPKAAGIKGTKTGGSIKGHAKSSSLAGMRPIGGVKPANIKMGGGLKGGPKAGGGYI